MQSDATGSTPALDALIVIMCVSVLCWQSIREVIADKWEAQKEAENALSLSATCVRIGLVVKT